MGKDPSTFGPLEMAAVKAIIATVTGTQPVYTQCQSVVLPKTARLPGTPRRARPPWRRPTPVAVWAKTKSYVDLALSCLYLHLTL